LEKVSSAWLPGAGVRDKWGAAVELIGYQTHQREQGKSSWSSAGGGGFGPLTLRLNAGVGACCFKGDFQTPTGAIEFDTLESSTIWRGGSKRGVENSDRIWLNSVTFFSAFVWFREWLKQG
jgi:hypothetical protein